MDRWFKAASQPGGPCKHCGRETVRLHGLRAIGRPKDQGDIASFQICATCDAVLPGPVVR